MAFFVAIILGFIEGFTEFLPISSTGHLILVNQWLAFAPEFTKLFDVVIQCGAIMAAVVVFWKKLFVWEMWKKIMVAVFPAMIVGAVFGSTIQTYLFSPIIVALALIVGGFALFFLETRRHAQSLRTTKAITYAQALMIGLAQCLAFIPGMSRSAVTIISALLLGASRPVAAEFSFFLAIPTLIAASVYSLLKTPIVFTWGEATLLGVGFLTAFFTALLVIRLFLKHLQERTFVPFAYYRIVLGLVILLIFAS